MTQPSPPPTVPPELLDRDSLPALLDRLRANGPSELRIDLSGLSRLPTPVVQILLAAQRDGVRLRLVGAGPGVIQSLEMLGLAGALPLEGDGT